MLIEMLIEMPGSHADFFLSRLRYIAFLKWGFKKVNWLPHIMMDHIDSPSSET